MKSKPLAAIFGLLAVVAIVGVAPAFAQQTASVGITAGAGAGASADCVAAKNCYDPGVANVTPGTTVTWTNYDKVSHVVYSGKVTDDNAGSMFDSGLIKAGGTFQFTFANAGTYDYFCNVHPWMAGQVVVGAAATTPMSNMPEGNATVPEFGPVASIVLAIAVLSVVVFAAKTRVIPRL